ncbi:MAG: DUF998 domain-containing protein [Promethearchaeota archaeon]
MKKLNKVYEKIHASYFGIFGVVIFLIGLIPAIAVHNNFSFLTTFVSDLAVPGWNDLAIWFSIFWFITGIFMILFILGFTLFLQEKGSSKKSTNITCVLGVVSAIGILMLALFNTRDADFLHGIAQYVFFFPGILYLFSYAYLEHKLSEFPLWQALFNVIVAFFFILYLILFIVNRIDETLLVEAKVVAEWLFLFSNMLWFVETGIFILRK